MVFLVFSSQNNLSLFQCEARILSIYTFLFSAVCLGVSTAAPTIVTATISTGSDTSTRVDDHQQGDNTTLLGTIVIFLQ